MGLKLLLNEGDYYLSLKAVFKLLHLDIFFILYCIWKKNIWCCVITFFFEFCITLLNIKIPNLTFTWNDLKAKCEKNHKLLSWRERLFVILLCSFFLSKTWIKNKIYLLKLFRNYRRDCTHFSKTVAQNFCGGGGEWVCSKRISLQKTDK